MLLKLNNLGICALVLLPMAAIAREALRAHQICRGKETVEIGD
jgi:hypothetical protein